MAITILRNLTANYFYPSANPIAITVNSNNTGKCNFRYISDLYINGTKVYTQKLFPDPITGFGFINVQRVCEDYIQTLENLSAATNVLREAHTVAVPSAAYSIQLKIGEEYDNSTDCDGSVLQYLNLANTNSAYVFESAIDYELWPSFNTTNYVVGTTSNSTPFITNAPKEITLTYNDQFSYDFITRQTINVADWKVDVRTYDQSGVGIATYSYATNRTHTGVYRFRVHCGPYDINRIAATTVINPSVSRYTVNLRWGATTSVSEIRTFKLKNPTSFQSRFCFTDQWGSQANITMDHRLRSGLRIQRGVYQKNLLRNTGSGWSYDVGNRGAEQWQNMAIQNDFVSSFLKRDEALWVNEIFFSPLVSIYKRPELLEARCVATASGFGTFLYKKPEWAENTLNTFSSGSLFFFDQNGSKSGRYAIVSEPVENQVVVSGTFSVGDCGYIQKDVSYQKLPIVITTNEVNIPQKISGPQQIAFEFTRSYLKTTLR